MNLDIASQDGFELIEEAASDASLSQIPILVNSTSTENIEKAMRLGASDYFVQPMSVIDVDFQIPIKFKNLLKVRQAELILAGEAQPPDVSPAESIGEEPIATLAAVPDVDTAAPFEENADQEGDLTAAVAEAEPEEDIENLFEDDESDKLEPDQEGDLAAAVAEAEPEEDIENLFEDDESDKLEPDQDDDLAAVAEAEPEEDIENLFEDDESEKLEPDQDDDLAAVAEAEPEEGIENLFEDDESDKLEPDQDDDLAAVAEDEPEDIENLFEDDEEEPSFGDEKRAEIASMVAAGAVGATGTRSERSRVESDPTAAEILSEPTRKGSSPIWRSPDLARGAQKRLAEEGRLIPRKPRKKRMLLGVLALFLVGICIWAIWAKEKLNRTGDLTSVFPMPEFLTSEPPEILEPDMAMETPPVEPEAAKPEMEIEPMPESLDETVIRETELEDFERARQDAAAPSSREQRLARTRVVLRETVDRIAASGGS